MNYNGQLEWQFTKTITLTNLTGATQTITWDGSLDSGVASQNALSHANWTDQYEDLVEANNGNPIGITVPAPTIAEPWTYTYDITVTQTDTETYTFPNEQNPITWAYNDNTWLRSKYLTIQRAKDENNKYIYDVDYDGYDDNDTTEDNAQIDPITGELEDYEADDKYIYLMRAYNLTDSLSTYNNPQHAKSGYLNMLNTVDDIIPIGSISGFECEAHNGNLDGLNVYDGTTYHNIRFNVPVIDMPAKGLYIFYLCFEDNHANLYRNHISKYTNHLNSRDNPIPIEYFTLGNSKIIWCRGDQDYFIKSLTLNTGYSQAPEKWVNEQLPPTFYENDFYKYKVRAAVNGAFFNRDTYNVIGPYKNHNNSWTNNNDIHANRYSFAMSFQNKKKTGSNFKYTINSDIYGSELNNIINKYNSYFTNFDSGLGNVCNLIKDNTNSNYFTCGWNFSNDLTYFNNWTERRTLLAWTDKNDTFLIYTIGSLPYCQNLIDNLNNAKKILSNGNIINEYNKPEHQENLINITGYASWGKIENCVLLDGGGSSSLSYKNSFGIAINIKHEEDYYNGHIRKIPNIICVYSEVK
ncbi:MAG: hypothetical protein IJS60_10030 [Abditibacteriota bacterium]|nr:hypothetical protein [Abditibacteriota bacterium]